MSLEAQWFNAVNQGDMEQVTQLLEASPKLLVQLAGSDRRTALHIAAIHGNDQLVALLLTKARGVEEVLHVGDALFRTPLHLAARYGHEKVAAQLLATRVDPTLVDVSGMTPLHLAAQEGYSSVLELLLAAKPEMVDEVDANDRTVLHTAARKGHEQLVARLLVLRPQMVHAMDAMGRTALHYATAHGFDTVVGLLLAASPTAIYAVSDRGQNALHEAARNKQEAIANMLLEFVSYNEASKGRSSDGGGSGGSDGNRLVRAIDGEGHTVLHTVIERECSLQLVMRVLEVFPQALHVVSQRSETPFGIALRMRSNVVVEVLQWRLTLDDIILAIPGNCGLENFWPVVEEQCEALLLALNRDVMGAVYEYLGFDKKLCAGM